MVLNRIGYNMEVSYMIQIISKKKLMVVFCLLLAVILIIGITVKTTAMTHYEKVDFVTGLVTASALNVRQGPGLNYNIATKVYKNEYIRVFAKIGKWYVIQTDKDIVGVVSTEYVKPIYPNTNNNSAGNSNNSSLTADEKQVFDLINEQRKKAGLKELVIDEELQNVARVKAKDMVDNNYFSHTSPTYGSPFDMMKKYGITYRTAGENIAGNSSNSGAVTAWMNSSGHRENILNNAYNYTGIGVVNSSKYGKIYVQMFIGK